MRLTHVQLRRLEEAAALNAVSRTTMARILINRGARSIVDEERRARFLLGDDGT